MPTDVSPMADTVAADSRDTAPGSARSGSAGTDALELPRGAPVGRYLILERIGAGGMGIVYAAYDPKLDRRIALKALYAEGDPERDTAGRSRLVREAKAMARLSHPNVVTVYDVLVEGDRAFVAMELVEGHSLRAWLAARKRSWREVRDAFLQAGRGLAAAHDAGLIHRDFKLDNVFVGNDGRIRVGDFGLARAASAPPRGPTPLPAEEPAIEVSREGLLVGTPAYMAPDQLRGAPADERSDQFSFCAALYEGLYGGAPFEGTTLLSLMRAMEEERVRPAPPQSAVPRWLRTIVARGLRRRPADRFPTMRDLLAALESDPGKARRRRAIVGVGLLAVAALGAAVVSDRRAQALECRAVAQRRGGVWDDGQRSAVRAAFVATGRPYAEDTFARTVRVLDAYAADWTKESVASCEQGQNARAPTAPAADRAACLGGRLSELRAFVGVLGRADGDTVDRAVQAARALPGLDTCAGKEPLQGRSWPSDEAVRDEARALEEQMTLAAALRAGGRFAEGVAAAKRNVAEAERIAFPPLTARALLALAEAERDAGDLAACEATFHRASTAAEAAGDWKTAAEAWMGEARRAFARGDYARSDERFEHAAVWVDRVGDDDRLRGQLLLGRAQRLSEEGKYDEARPLDEKALALFERLGSDATSEALNALGVLDDMQGHYEEARSYYDRARERYERLLGPDHPSVARELNNLGLMAADQGKYDDGISALSRALQIEESARGAEYPSTLETLSNLALVYVGASRYAEALPLAERAVPAAARVFGPDSPDEAFALSALSGALRGLHRPAESLEPAERELAIRQRGGAPINLADAECDVGVALVESGRDRARGRALLQRARERFVAIGRSARLEEIDEALRGGPAQK